MTKLLATLLLLLPHVPTAASNPPALAGVPGNDAAHIMSLGCYLHYGVDSAVAILLLLLAILRSQLLSMVSAVARFPASAVVLTNILFKMVFLPVLTSLLLMSPDVPVVSCAAVCPSVALVLSSVNVPGLPAVARVYSGFLAAVDVTAFASVPVVVNILSAIGVSTGSNIPPAFVGVSCCSSCLLCCFQTCC